MRELPRDLPLILRTEAGNQRKPPIDYGVAEDGLRMVVRPEPDVAMAELLEEAAAALVAAEARATAAEARVRELVWEETLADRGDGSYEHDGGYEAETPIGVYTVDFDYFKETWTAFGTDSGCLGEPSDSPDTAKAMAQADYESRILSTLQEKPASPGPYEARMCKGIPTDCCDYAVISFATGKEVCRVWTEADARMIASALQLSPAQEENAALSDKIKRLEKEVAIVSGERDRAQKACEGIAQRLTDEREQLALAICGGEDAPGYANAHTVEALVEIARQQQRDHRADIDRATAAEARVTELEGANKRLQTALEMGLDLISNEKGWGTYPRMEGSEIYDDADKFEAAALAAIGRVEA